MSARFPTHEVFNQPPPFEDVNLFTSDVALIDAVEREGGSAACGALGVFGQVAGSAEAQERGRLANEHTPKLSTHDRQGRRRDTVTFHPAYHTLMRTSCAEGLHASVWAHLGKKGEARRPGAHVARAGAFYMAAQMEAGHCCPITMTNAAVPVLLQQPDVAAEWLPRILASSYDPSFAPPGGQDRRHPRHGHDGEAGRHRRARGDDQGRAGRRRRIPHHRPQVVPVGADVGCLPRPGAGARRPHLLSDAALPARRQRQRAASAAAEGQARQPLQRFGRGGIPRRLCARHRRGGTRRRHHHRHGHLHPPRLRRRLGGPDALCARQCHPPRRAPQRVRQEARRAAGDAAGAGRHGARRRGGGRARVPPRARLRSRRGSARLGLAPPHDAGDQILGVQAGPAAGRGGDGMSRRQRLRRGGAAGAALSRGAGQLDLGRLGQRHGARRARAFCSASPRPCRW